jgi:hypothetical protein
LGEAGRILLQRIGTAALGAWFAETRLIGSCPTVVEVSKPFLLVHLKRKFSSDLTMAFPEGWVLKLKKALPPPQ